MSKPKTSEANFRAAFERLKAGAPKLLPVGSTVSQNHVAMEAGCVPSALRKSRFPKLVEDIQEFLKGAGEERPTSERQRLIEQRQKSRTSRQTMKDLKAQRDQSATLLVEANAQLSILFRKIRDLEVRLEELQPKAGTVPLGSAKRRSSPRGMDDPYRK